MGLRGFQPHRREQAAGRIEEMIREQGLWGQRLPGEREMAAALEISRGTIQRALEMLELRGTIKRRHGSGTFASDSPVPEHGAERSVKRVAILASRSLWPTKVWDYYPDMIKGSLRACTRLGVEALLISQEEAWMSAPGPRWEALKEFDAFLMVEHDDPELARQLLKLRRGPVALLDATFRDLPVIAVVDGSFEGARHAVGYLVRQGHRRIAYIAPGERPEAPHEKTQGYNAALAEAGIVADGALVCRMKDENMERDVRGFVERFTSLSDPPTALFAGTDIRAVAAIGALQEAGVRVGVEFAVMGFGDSAFRTGLSTTLSSVRIHTRKMGSLAIQALLDAGREPAARTIIVPDRLMIRGTTCARSDSETTASEKSRKAECDR